MPRSPTAATVPEDSQQASSGLPVVYFRELPILTREGELMMNKVVVLLAVVLLPSLIAVPVLEGITWQSMGPSGGGNIMTSCYHPTDANTVFLGGDVSGMHKSTDGGASWRQVNTGLAASDETAAAYGIMSIAISGSSPRIMYIGTWRGIFKSTDGGESWTCRMPSSPSGSDVLIGAVAVDPDSSQRVYAGVGDYFEGEGGTGTFYRSTDGGNTWETIAGTGIDSQAIFSSIVVDPTTSSPNQTLFATTNKSVYRSMDSGSNWSSIQNAVLPHGDSWLISLHESGGTVTLYLSLRIHGDPADVGSYSGGIFKSTDRGNSWVDVTNHLPKHTDWDPEFYWYDWMEMALHPTDANIVYVGAWNENGHEQNGVHKTIDGGLTWAWSSQTIPDPGWLINFAEGADYLSLSPVQPDTVIWGSNEVYKSPDAGVNWTQSYCTSAGGGYWRGSGLELTYVYCLAFDPATAGRFYIGYEDVLFFRTEDDGQSFKNTYTDSPQDDPNDAITAMFVDPASPNIIYASFAPQGAMEYDDLTKGGVFESTDYGDNWTQIGEPANGLPAGRNIIALDTSGSPSSRTIYAAVYGQGVYKTIDGGTSWSAINSGLGSDKNYAAWLKIDPSQPQHLYLGIDTKGTGTGGLYKTTDGGVSWSRLKNFPSYDLLSIEVDPNNSSNVYAAGNVPSGGGYEGGLYKSTDGGAGWTEILDEPWVNDVTVHPENSRVVYAVSSQYWEYSPSQSCGFYKSSDGGSTWTVHNQGLGNLYLYCIEIDPHSPDKIYVGTHGCGFYRGIDSVNPIIESGDYDGDGRSDIAVFRESSGLWAVRGITRVYFGAASDLPVSGDYDGDGTAAIGIFRGSIGLWAVRGVTRAYFGSSSDQPVPGDYDGDGSCDTGIFRSSTGLWAVRDVTRAYFGRTGDDPVPGCYGGNGTQEIVVFRGSSGLWALRNISRIYFGSGSDRPIPGDYNGSGTWSVGIFRPASGLWAIRSVTRSYFGGSSDQPVPADYNGDSTDDIGIFREISGLWAVRGVSRLYFGTAGDIPVTR